MALYYSAQDGFGESKMDEWEIDGAATVAYSPSGQQPRGTSPLHPYSWCTKKQLLATATATAGYPCSGPSPWLYITCNTEGRVTELDLSGLEIEGSLPVELREMDELKVLNLDNNRQGPAAPESSFRAIGAVVL